MIKFTIFVTFQRESGDWVLKATVSDLPALIFVELVHHSNKRSLSVGQKIDFDDFTENPSFFFMVAIYDHIFFELIFVKDRICTKMSTNKIIIIVYQLKSIQFILLSNFEVMKSTGSSCEVIIFDNILTMHFSQNVISVAETKFVLESRHELSLYKWISTRVAFFFILTMYFKIYVEVM